MTHDGHKLAGLHPQREISQRAGFHQVSGLEATIDVVDFREGGENTTMRKLFGLTRFSNYVEDWEPEQVRLLTELLEKLRSSMAADSVNDPRPATTRRWAQTSDR